MFVYIYSMYDSHAEIRCWKLLLLGLVRFGEDLPFNFEENCYLEGLPLNCCLPRNPLDLLAAILVVCVSLAVGLCSAFFNKS